MAEGDFLAKPLGTLGAIYRFVGGLRSVSNVYIAAGIQLVHDVSDEAERGATVIFDRRHSILTAGGGAPVFTVIEVADLFAEATLADALLAYGRVLENTDVYLMGIEAKLASGTAGNLTALAAGMLPPLDLPGYVTIGLTATGIARSLYFADTEMGGGSVTVSGGTRPVIDGTNTLSARSTSPWKLPQRFGILQLRTEDDAVGAITATWMESIAFVPKGAKPPPAS